MEQPEPPREVLLWVDDLRLAPDGWDWVTSSREAIDILARELTTTMGLCGVNRISEIDDHVLAT